MALLKLQTTWRSSRERHSAYQKIKSLHLILESVWTLLLRVTYTRYVWLSHAHDFNYWTSNCFKKS